MTWHPPFFAADRAAIEQQLSRNQDHDAAAPEIEALSRRWPTARGRPDRTALRTILAAPELAAELLALADRQPAGGEGR
ncbi:hypothetical protein [Streptomyces virginiae]|uniref:hypothetical protein n=1 Tax=Streptomyces virginiae TaxID=1961 RepID=UPI0036C3A74D